MFIKGNWKKNKKINRVLAMILCIALVVSINGTSGVGPFAAEGDGSSYATGTDALNEANDSAVEATPVGEIAPEIPSDAEVNINVTDEKASDETTSDETVPDEMTSEEECDPESAEDTAVQSDLSINFAVVESGRFDTPAENKYIVLDMGDESVSFEDAELTLINEYNGVETILDVDTILDTTLLFYASFPDTSYAGKYRVASVRYTSGGILYEKNLMDDEMAPRFGVDCDVTEDPDLWLTEDGELTAENPEDGSSTVGTESVKDIVNVDPSLGNEIIDLSEDFDNANVIAVDGENSEISLSDSDISDSSNIDETTNDTTVDDTDSDDEASNLTNSNVTRDLLAPTKELNSNELLSSSLKESSLKEFDNLVFSKAPENIIIVLDPGHGGSDKGACRTWNGVEYCERDINQMIANAVKDELAKYGNVTVYMTRTSTSEGLHGSVGNDLQWRCDYAHEVGADLFVSLHCNSSLVDNTRNGAEVYIPNSSFSTQAHNVAKAVGSKIGEKLAALGIANGTTYTKNSESGDTYEDGSICDYYAVIRHCKEYSIPGMIVEHAYINNQSDCENFFGTEDKIKALGKADAEAIAENIGLIEQNRVNSDMKITGWRKSGDTYVYYIDGNVQTGFFVVDGKMYYGRENGQVVQGWQLIDGYYYLFDGSGASIQNSWVQDGSGMWTYLDAAGRMATGITDAGGTWYLMDGNGHMLTGWQYYGDRWYYMNESGVMYRDCWVRGGQGWYYMCSDGHMASNETIYSGGYRYFLSSSGLMSTGWMWDGANWYYASDSGALYLGCWAKYNKKWYYFDGDGKMVTGKVNLGGALYYMYGDGSMATGWIYDGVNWYCATDSGNLYLGCWYKENKKWYYFDGNGAMQTGFVGVGEQTYYLDSSGALVDGWFTVGSEWYYATGSGALLGSSWLESNGKWYYFDSDYKMATGSRILGDTIYYFSDSGAMIRSEAYVAPVDTSTDNSSSADAGNKTTELYAVMGGTTHTATELAARFTKEGKAYPTTVMAAGGAANIEEFCKIIVEEANAEGVKAEVVFGQIMHETGYLQFGGSVAPEQYNFCGLGAVNANEKGYEFPDVRTGIRAEVQHLKGYASTEALKQDCVDPRFKYIERGCAPYVQYLGIKENPNGKGWATSDHYGDKIMNIINSL